MRDLSSALGHIAWDSVPDGSLLRVRWRALADRLVTLGMVLLAAALTVGYQLLPRLPASWRDALLPPEPPAE